MLAQALKRPKNYLRLHPPEQWSIDKKLGILDWEGPTTDEDLKVLKDHFGLKVEKRRLAQR